MMTIDDLIARDVAVGNQELLAQEVEAFAAYRAAVADAELAEDVAHTLLAERACELETWRRNALNALHERVAEKWGAGATRQ